MTTWLSIPRTFLALPLVAVLLSLITVAAAQTGFGPQQVITTSARAAFSVYAADLDGDGDQDVLSASNFDDKIAWYENVGSAMDTDVEIASDVLPSEIEIRIFPNPASASLFIRLVGARPEPYRVGVFDLLGRRVIRTEENTIGGAIESYILDYPDSRQAYMLSESRHHPASIID